MKTLIIGGGLSGLALAHALEQQGRDYVLLEARARFGGRIKTEHVENGYFDMGPAWFWPGQPRIAALAERLGIDRFEQYATGDLIFENEHGKMQRGRGFSSMEGSWRFVGGLAALTQGLSGQLPDQRKKLKAKVTKLTHSPNGIMAELTDGNIMDADQVVLSLPPRVATQIDFAPQLPQNTQSAMHDTATWMAGQAKAIAVYDAPFWRQDGLSGDAQSRCGPMVEIHDASPAIGGPYALFGFIGIPPEARRDERALRAQIIAQLARMFGPKAAVPMQLYVKDWASDPLTSVEADKAPMFAHPSYQLHPNMVGLWKNTLHFSGTETAPVFGGYLEGALEAAENVLKTLAI